MSRWDTLDGGIVEVPDHVLGVVEDIRFRFPSYRVVYLNPDHPDAGIDDPPWAVIDDNRNIILTAWEMDQRVVDRLVFGRDAIRMKKQHELDKLAQEAALKAKKEEVSEKNKDVLLHAFRSPKTTYTYKNEDGEITVITDDPKGVS